ncbi:MAG: sugar transferase [Methylothermaceae bacteria B42]|nr:MAG: sugar transferase [Methylothermaceae bacteria B42]HHJ39806.1 TIGR03013 family PEP-CTERM/XrtA system glycosyltransferase [Methylothermaceae bacterium]
MPTIRIFRHYVSTAYLGLLVFEFTLYFSAIYIGSRIRFLRETGWEADPDLSVTSVLFAITMIACSAGAGLYQRRSSWSGAGLLLRLIVSFMMGTVVMSLIFYAFPEMFIGRGVFGFALLFSFLGTIALRYAFYTLVDSNRLKRRILVLGAGNNAKKIIEFGGRVPYDNLAFIGFVPMSEEPPQIEKELLISMDAPLNEFASREDIDEIVVAPDDRRRGFPVDEILDCKMNGFDVMDLLSFFEREAGIVKIDCLYPSWLVFSDGFRMSSSVIIKRLFDIVASMILLVVAWPVMLLTAMAIMLESGVRQPIFYHQVRVGADWKLFKVIKFRSMRPDAEKDGKARMAKADDDRVTRVGRFIRKTRIDELPQLWNVLKGDMSFVGPRPERPEFVEKFAEIIPYYSERHRVKPGITGWAQVRYPYAEDEADTVEKLQYDLYYVKNYSLLLDFLIMLQTVEVVLWRKGAR